LEVVPPIVVAAESLTRLSSDIETLELEVSEVLDLSLSEVCTRYFEGSNESEVDQVVAEEQDCLREDPRHWEEWEEAAIHEHG
jgi:hypothetical protein